MDGPDCCALLKVHTYREVRLGQVLTGEADLIVVLGIVGTSVRIDEN